MELRADVVLSFESARLGLAAERPGPPPGVAAPTSRRECAEARDGKGCRAPARLFIYSGVASLARAASPCVLPQRIRENRQPFMGLGGSRLRYRNPGLRTQGRRDLYRPNCSELVRGLSEAGCWQSFAACRRQSSCENPGGQTSREAGPCRRQAITDGGKELYTGRAWFFRCSRSVGIQSASKRHRGRTTLLSLRGSAPYRSKLRRSDCRAARQSTNHRGQRIGQENHRGQATRGTTPQAFAAIQAAGHWRKLALFFFQAKERALLSPLYQVRASEMLPVTARGWAESNGDRP